MTEFSRDATAADIAAHFADADTWRNKVAIVTGATGGIGRETALALASLGVRLVIGARNPDKAERLRAELAALTTVHVLPLDLSQLDSVRRFVAEFHALALPLHILINNAASTFPKFGRDESGRFERTFAINYLAPFLLTNLLADKLKEQPNARVVNLAIIYQLLPRVPPLGQVAELLEHDYDLFKAYGLSKSPLLLFSLELNRRLQSAGVSVLVVHPGVVATDILRGVDPNQREKLREGFHIKSIAQGAATPTFAALSPAFNGNGGHFLVDCAVQDIASEAYAKSTSVDAQAEGESPLPFDLSVYHQVIDPSSWARLWSETEAALGVSFTS